MHVSKNFLSEILKKENHTNPCLITIFFLICMLNIYIYIFLNVVNIKKKLDINATTCHE